MIGGKVVAQGYFAGASNENVNFQEIDGTRYFCTGDIGEIFPDGTLNIIGSFYFIFFSISTTFLFRSKKRFN